MAASATRHDGDFKQKTAGLAYTPDFNDALEAISHDRLATSAERILAWIKRNSWGRNSWYAITADQKVAWQSDCAAELKIDKRRVSKVIKYLIQRGYLQNELKLLYPVVSPQLDSYEKVAGGGDFFINFLAEWKVAHSTDFSELEVSRSNVARIRRMMLSDFKRWRASRTSAEKSPEVPVSERRLKSVGTYLPTRDISRYVGTESPGGLSDQPTDQPAIKSPEPESPQTEEPSNQEPSGIEREILALPTVRQLQKRLHSMPSPELLRKIAQNLQGAPLEGFNARIEQRFASVKTFGFLQHLASDVGNAYRQACQPNQRSEATQRNEAETQRRLKIEAWKAIMEDPDESPQAKAEAMKFLEAVLP